jgi:E1A/CREB-binding protein
VSGHQKELRHKQQRLLLLQHAAQCQHEDGHCQVTRHCAGMRRLWMHIGDCSEKECLVPHFVSSRYILSHYHRCKDFRCPVCGPVRKAIHRDHVVKQKQKEADARAHTVAWSTSNSAIESLITL